MRKSTVIFSFLVFVLGACAGSIMSPTGSRPSRAQNDWTYETAMNTLRIQGSVAAMQMDLSSMRDDVSRIKEALERAGGR